MVICKISEAAPLATDLCGGIAAFKKVGIVVENHTPLPLRYDGTSFQRGQWATETPPDPEPIDPAQQKPPPLFRTQEPEIPVLTIPPQQACVLVGVNIPYKMTGAMGGMVWRSDLFSLALGFSIPYVGSSKTSALVTLGQGFGNPLEEGYLNELMTEKAPHPRKTPPVVVHFGPEKVAYHLIISHFTTCPHHVTQTFQVSMVDPSTEVVEDRVSLVRNVGELYVTDTLQVAESTNGNGRDERGSYVEEIDEIACVDSLYSLLDVKSDATNEEIRRAYRRAALRLHPDRNKEVNPEHFKRVVFAYEVLSDPVKREQYDKGEDPMETDRSEAPDPMFTRASEELFGKDILKDLITPLKVKHYLNPDSAALQEIQRLVSDLAVALELNLIRQVEEPVRLAEQLNALVEQLRPLKTAPPLLMIISRQYIQEGKAAQSSVRGFTKSIRATGHYTKHSLKATWAGVRLGTKQLECEEPEGLTEGDLENDNQLHMIVFDLIWRQGMIYIEDVVSRACRQALEGERCKGFGAKALVTLGKQLGEHAKALGDTKVEWRSAYQYPVAGASTADLEEEEEWVSVEHDADPETQ